MLTLSLTNDELITIRSMLEHRISVVWPANRDKLCRVECGLLAKLIIAQCDDEAVSAGPSGRERAFNLDSRHAPLDEDGPAF